MVGAEDYEELSRVESERPEAMIECRQIKISNKAELEELRSVLFQNFDGPQGGPDEDEWQFITGRHLVFSADALPRGLAIWEGAVRNLDADEVQYPLDLSFGVPVYGGGPWLTYYEDCLDQLTRFGFLQWGCTWLLAAIMWRMITCQSSLPTLSLIPIFILLVVSIYWEWAFVERSHIELQRTFFAEQLQKAWAKIRQPSFFKLHSTNFTLQWHIKKFPQEGKSAESSGVFDILFACLSPSSLHATYLFGLLERLDFISDALMVPQAFACMENIQDKWLASWRDSVFSFVAVPVFQNVGFGPFIAILYAVTILILQGCRPFLDIRGKYRGLEEFKKQFLLSPSDKDVHEDVSALFPYPPAVGEAAGAFGLLTCSKLFMTVQSVIDEDEEGDGFRHDKESIDIMDSASDRALINEILYKVVAENVVQMYVSSSFFALTFETKSASGRGILVATSCLSMVSALLKLKSLRQLKTDKYSNLALFLIASVIIIIIAVIAKLAGAFLCQDSHMLNIIPPHCASNA